MKRRGWNTSYLFVSIFIANLQYHSSAAGTLQLLHKKFNDVLFRRKCSTETLMIVMLCDCSAPSSAVTFDAAILWFPCDGCIVEKQKKMRDVRH